MILGSRELDEYVVEPSMKLEPFDPKLIKEITRNHPYKILLRILYKYYPSYNTGEGNDADPKYDDYNDNIVDFYFRMLDDYNRYGIAFERETELFPDNILCVKEGFLSPSYYLVNNHYDKKTLLFNKVKTIDLNDHDRGEKPLKEEEKQKRNIIKKQTNKKLQVAMMDPDFYNYSKNFNNVFERPNLQKLLIKRFNYRMTWDGFDDFIKEKYD